MPGWTTLLTSALAAASIAGFAAAQDPAEGPAGAAQADAPAIEMADGRIVFRDPLSDEVLDIPHEDVTPAVAEFHRSGENPYAGDEEAVAEGRTLYNQWCASCHLPAGTGRIGPSLVDDRWRNPRAETDVGFFEVVHAGGAGAMQAFGDRLSQDEILRTMAYVDELRAQAQR